NPELVPYEVVNFDLSYSHYFRKTGSLTLSLFRKSFTNWIVDGCQTMTEELANSIGMDESDFEGGVFEDYDLVTRFNIKDKGYYNGLEFSFGETLSFLPRPFKTLSIQASLTLIKITPITTDRVLVADNPASNASMVDQVHKSLKSDAMPVTASLYLSWRYKKLAVTSSIKHTGRTLRAVSPQTIQWDDRRDADGKYINEYINTMTRAEARTTVDLKLEYRWNSLMRPYLQVKNLFNARARRTIDGYNSLWSAPPAPTYEIGFRGYF
ncbi:MAG: TonB-dependent receptor, partial [Kiritimatiellaeota bacterium]|nr:TonB-dependent receptor [Kiritimatiellota bacterium]